MARKTRHATNDRPHVALLVETSLISGRHILRGISRYLREHSPWVVYHEPRSLEAVVPAWLKTWHGQGIIVRLQDQRVAEVVLEKGLPTVDVLGVVSHSGVPLVHVDNVAIGRLAAQHLLQCGFRHFGYCGTDRVNWAETRGDAFATTVGEAGCSVAVHQVILRPRSDASWENQQEQLARWIRGLPKPVGIMACYDPVGQKVLEACRRAAVTVPDEVAVIGVDNDETVCEVCSPPLSSVMANHAWVGYEAASLLARMMNGEKAPCAPHFVQPAGVAARLSSDTLAVSDHDVAAALAFIRARACEGIGVQDVVAHVSVSHTTLKERFRRLLGRSIRDEIIHCQLFRAQELLAKSDIPLRAIARQAGFRHQEYLGVVFKARLGKTPGQYRKEARIGQ